jgi:hypothetical protein
MVLVFIMFAHVYLQSLPIGLLYVALAGGSAIFIRLFYNLYLHPLAKYPGPWYAATTSLSLAMVSVLKIEPQWLQSLVKKYGSK